MKNKDFPQKNSLHTLRVTDMNNLGAGVGRIDNIVTFVQGGCTGDLAEVKIIKSASAYLVARIERLIEPSPHRAASDCAQSKRCGGCVFRGITYEHELELKRGFVESAMKKAGVEVSVGQVRATGVIEGYRNKAQLPVGAVSLGKGEATRTEAAVGFYAERTHEIIPLGEDTPCRLNPDVFSRIAAFVCDWMSRNNIKPYDEQKHTGTIRHLYLRRSETMGEVMLCVVSRIRFERMDELAGVIREAFPEVVSVWENINPDRTNVVLGREYRLVSGKELLTDKICGRTFEISPESFWQVNRTAAELLYNTAAELAGVRSGERVLDLFCGIGTVGMSICPTDAELYGIEIVPRAVENARRNAALNGFGRAVFSCCDASAPDAIGREIGRIAEGGLDLVILDPPRKGCAPELIDLLASSGCGRIVYISCNPDTLARDLAHFVRLGYAPGEVTPVDMFPHTSFSQKTVKN